MSIRSTRSVLEVVEERDYRCCAWCGRPITGTRSVDWSLHHRRPRGMGGDRRPETHGAANQILLHGSGTTACHGLVESSRALSFERGFLVPKNGVQTPSQFAIEHAVHGLCYLRDDGTWEEA